MIGSQSDVLGLATRPAPVMASYEERYGLAERPFGLSPDVRYAYFTGSYGEALNDTLLALRRREGLIVITGEAGTGKTLLCRLLLQQLDEHTCVSAVLDPYVTFEELLLLVLRDFGVVHGGTIAPAGAGRQQLLATLQQFLSSLISRNAYAVIVIDEAQDLAPAVLEQIRLLLNFETDEAKLLQVVLVGQLDLEQSLRRPETERLQQRVARRCELRPLSPQETAGYIERRLSMSSTLAAIGSGDPVLATEAGSGSWTSRVRFTPAAIRAAWAISGGNPRAINLLCDRALAIGHEQTALTIDRGLVRRARRCMERTPARKASRARVAALSAAVLIIGVPGGWFLAARGAQSSLASAEIRPVMAPAVARIEPAANTVSATTPDGMPVDSTDSLMTSWLPGSPTSMLPVGGSTLVAVASMTEGPEASAVVAQLDRAGLPAFARQQMGRHQVVAGPYLSRIEAEDAQRILATRGFTQTRVLVTNGSSGSVAPGAGTDAVNTGASGLESSNVVLLAPGGRTSVVLEMASEPRQVLVRRRGDGIFEVDAGPVTAPLRARRLIAPAGVSLLQGLSIQNVAASGREPFVRARLHVPALTRGNVRVSGRHVYIDLERPASAGGPPGGSAPQVDALVVVKPDAVKPDGAKPEVAKVEAVNPEVMKAEVVKAEGVKPDGGDAPSLETYRRSIDAALNRFEEIAPFLLSAIATPQADVLAAVALTLETLGASIGIRDVPAEVRSDHDLFASVVAQAGRVVEPTFAGDRRAEALRAIAQFAEVKRRLRNES